MRPVEISRSEPVAWLVGGAVLAVLAAVAFWLVGWLGIGLLGLIGLVISTRVDLHGGHAVEDSGFGSSAVGMYARQIEQQESQRTPEQRMACAAERAQRSRTLYLVNTAFIAMTVLGLGLFFLHQI